MIKDSTILSVKDAAVIEDIIMGKITLKRKGGNVFVGLCPFHEEKTPSFSVSPAKGIYKCFGCGAAGDAIRFIMNYDHLPYPDAIRYLAELYHIPVEENKTLVTPEDADETRVMYEINEFCAEAWHKNLLALPADHPVMQELTGRRQHTMDTITDFRLGYAPEKWGFIKDQIVGKGWLTAAIALGIVTRKEIEGGDEKNFDTHRNQVTFPFYNLQGKITGFGYQNFSKESAEAEEDADAPKFPKYVNSWESKIYSKGSSLYGLRLAERAIRKDGYAILVEGYHDVISFQQAGLSNTIGASGTAFTEKQAALLKKYTRHAVLVGDGDNAGRKAMMKQTDILLAEGFQVECVELPDKEDPDSYIRTLELEVLMN